jgi:hypothetical protein
MDSPQRTKTEDDVINCLDAALWRLRRHPRVDTSTMSTPLGSVATRLEHRAEVVASRLMGHIAPRCFEWVVASSFNVRAYRRTDE